MGLFSPEKRKLWGEFIAAFRCLKGAYSKAGDFLPGSGMTGKGVTILILRRVDLH